MPTKPSVQTDTNTKKVHADTVFPIPHKGIYIANQDDSQFQRLNKKMHKNKSNFSYIRKRRQKKKIRRCQNRYKQFTLL